MTGWVQSDSSFATEYECSAHNAPVSTTTTTARIEGPISWPSQFLFICVASWMSMLSYAHNVPDKEAFSSPCICRVSRSCLFWIVQ